MTNVINFPVKFTIYNETPRKRVFYLGYRYVGPMFCQEVQNLFLKRHGSNNGERRWSIIIYASYSDTDRNRYAIELDFCFENDVHDMVENLNLEDEVTPQELRQMGWTGSALHCAKIVSISHSCYNGVILPDFVKPLHTSQFGIKIIGQGSDAREILEGEKIYSFTIFGSGDDGWVWMNLAKHGSTEIKTVPVRIVKQLSLGFRIKNYKNKNRMTVKPTEYS
jgi:hypothetical protein